MSLDNLTNSLQVNAAHDDNPSINMFGWFVLVPAKLRPDPLGQFPLLGYVLGHEVGHTLHRRFLSFGIFHEFDDTSSPSLRPNLSGKLTK